MTHGEELSDIAASPLYESPLKRPWSQSGYRILTSLGNLVSSQLGYMFQPKDVENRGVHLMNVRESRMILSEDTKLGRIGPFSSRSKLKHMLPESALNPTEILLHNLVVAPPKRGTCNVLLDLRQIDTIMNERQQLTKAIDSFQGTSYEWDKFTPFIKIGHIISEVVHESDLAALETCAQQVNDIPMLLEPVQ